MLITPVSAASASVDKMTITTTLDQNGNAHIKEVWQMNVHEGTEVYKIMKNMGNKKIKNLKVKDEKNDYLYLSHWDVDASREEKRNKCGLVNSESGYYELCFGVGDYGNRTYTFEYDVTHFVEQYDGDQGFNFAFFSDLQLDVDQVRITIEYPGYKFSKENSSIYAFGYKGYDVFNSGKVVMGNDEALDNGSNKMQILMRINDGTFKNLTRNSRRFDDILKEAKEGSDYDSNDNSILIFIFGFIFFFVTVLMFIVIVAAIIRNKNKECFEDGDDLNIDIKDMNMFRDIPCQRDIFRFYYLAKKAVLISEDDRSGLISAILLKWVKEGYIVFEKRTEKHMIFFSKDGFSIDLDREIITGNTFEQQLLNNFRKASGKNMALETGEFESWCSKHYEKIEDWFEDIDNHMNSQLKKEQLFRSEKRISKVLFFKVKNYTKVYSMKVKEEMEHIVGLKKFLLEMSSIDEKEVIEVKLWEEYLIFASILGIAEKVEKQLGELCPNFVEESNIDIYYTTSAIRTFSHAGVYAAHSAMQAESMGSGGSSSFGGGGGSFSGGGGGGVR